MSAFSRPVADPPPAPQRRIEDVLACLTAMRSEGGWPAGPRCLRTDAHGLALLVSLHRRLGEAWLLEEACLLADEVGRALAPARDSPGGPAGGPDAQRLQPIGMWIFCLGLLGEVEPAYRSQGLGLARSTYGPGSSRGTGSLDAFLGYAACNSLDGAGLSGEIAELRTRIEGSYRDLVLTRDEEIGTMLWLTHLHPREPWAELQRGRCLRVLEHMWVEQGAWFCRAPGRSWERCLAANQGISIGLQAVGAMPERVEALRRSHGLGGRWPAAAQVLACCAEFPGELLRAQ